uniref:dual specificity protein kinase zak2-like n=1 Tax=Erigeron canadensis TaxID=72917 RepID=UPI001CB9B48B|nr:dual specificity protein kinase zak2-like [Erigeron canadensis]
MSYLDDHKHLKIELKVIQEATDCFRNSPIGIGGFGVVYKAELFLREGPTVVAIKRLDRKNGQGDVEFWKEITMLSELQHENLATLLQFCSEDKERILVYKYASLGSLDKYLSDTRLTWTQRLKICIGAAKGIAYLHDPRKTQHRVLHRDIKSSNILLDDKWTAIVSDFGLSKIGPANQPRSYVVSNAVGTPGYCDPVYFETGILSKECDVYSFGVVLFEVLCGRLCCVYDKNQIKSILVQQWRKCYVENRLGDIIFPDLKEQIGQESLLTFSAIAYQCLDRDHTKRPNMVEIQNKLGIALLQQDTSQHQAIVAKTPMSYRFMEEFQHLKICLEEVKWATNNFNDKNVIGFGGFGKVYKGALNLAAVGNRIVAIKRLDRRYGQGEAEFWKDVMMLSRYKHENLLSLIKVCNEHEESILVYEYASLMSLDCHLNSTHLTWIQRVMLCLGVACALNYLHGPSEKQVGVVHQDIKSSKILLIDRLNVKLSGFGMSKVVTGNELQNHPISDDIVGTPGYCDPAYFETGILSKASDVYSFGVVLFEVLCGKICYEYINGQMKILVPTWRKSYEEQRLDDIIFSDLKGQMYSGSLDTFSSIAYQCVRKDPQERPTIAKVMKELEVALQQQEHFEEMMSIENLVVSRSLISSASNNQPLMQFPEGVLVGDGNTWLSKHKNGKVCEIISALLCISGDSLIPDSTENSRFANVLRGGIQNGFKVKARTQFLSPKVTYAVSLVFNHNAADLGTRHIPFKFKMDTESHYSNLCITHAREDGWQMIELCQFTSDKRENDIGFEFLPLFTITSSSIEYVVEGIEFRPVEYVS